MLSEIINMNYLVVLLMLLWIGFTYACTCAPRSEAEMFCSPYTKFGALVKTKDDGNTNTSIVRRMRRYKIRTVEMFKSGTNKVNKNVIFTNLNSAGCGVTLEAHTYYVLTGDVIDLNKGKKKPGSKAKKNRMKVSICDLVKKVNPPECPSLDDMKPSLTNYKPEP
ncbi:uncharacterized protein LOC123536430 [Mercenaria mercenaria]|uniref:uncharacterized protein LOC123536430 n=1 Tax=Mercenaria mercenaria TaxID=6596 RepID=UPI00234F75E6|nr:uncharacterized protein LOC123536430 [Mercenaria mercenaria]